MNQTDAPACFFDMRDDYSKKATTLLTRSKSAGLILSVEVGLPVPP